MRTKTLLIPLLLSAALAACEDEYEAPEYAEPADTVAVRPGAEVIPDEDEPGPQ